MFHSFEPGAAKHVTILENSAIFDAVMTKTYGIVRLLLFDQSEIVSSLSLVYTSDGHGSLFWTRIRLDPQASDP